jgi:MoxR-like ATPase
MQERQVTISDYTYPLEEPFLVMATQNPIEQEGTYPLPEAQVDRFMLKLNITYPSKEEELEIMNRMAAVTDLTVKPVVTPADILKARKVVHEVYMDEKIDRYIVDIVYATRKPSDYGLQDIEPLISFGASPRASINLKLAAKAHAFLRQRGYVTPEDVKAIGMDVLRHRIIVTYEAEAEEVTSEDVVRRVLNHIEVP